MAGFEELIRDTLARQGEPTHANRARVYASARSALERMIERNEAEGTADPDAAQAQRENLEEAIERIEDEHAARLSARDVRDEPVPEVRDEPVPEVRDEPAPPPVRIVSEPAAPTEPSPEPAPRPVVEPSPPPPTEPSAPPPTVAVAPVVSERPVPRAPETRTPEPSRAKEGRAGRREAKRAARLLDGRPKRRPFAKLLLWAIILAGVATAAWWAWTFGPDYTDTLGPVPNPPQIDVPSESGVVDDGWITVFDPRADIAGVTTGEAASSRIVEDGDRAWLRFASSADPDVGQAGLVRVTVPPGIMRSLANRRATFEATVRTAPGVASHPFSVVCEFTAGNCNRTRFDAQSNVQSFLFAADLGDGEDAGALVFDTDLEDLGRAIDLGAVRVAVQ